MSSKIRKQLDTVMRPKSKATWVETTFSADVEDRDVTSEGLLRGEFVQGAIKIMFVISNDTGRF